MGVSGVSGVVEVRGPPMPKGLSAADGAVDAVGCPGKGPAAFGTVALGGIAIVITNENAPRSWKNKVNTQSNDYQWNFYSTKAKS